MADSAFIALAKLLKTLLEAAPPIADKVYRDRKAAVAKNLTKWVVIRIDKTQGVRGGTDGSPVDWGTLFAIECVGRCPADQEPTDFIDPLLQAAYGRIVEQGGQIGIDVEDLMPDPRIEWDIEEGDTPEVSATFQVRIVHRTPAVTLQPWG